MVNVTRTAGSVNECQRLVQTAWWWQARYCPLCGRRMHLHGSYERYADDGVMCEKIAVRRYRCPDCRRTFSYPPSFLRPYRSVVVAVQERAAQGWAAGCLGGAWRESWAGRMRRFAGM